MDPAAPSILRKRLVAAHGNQREDSASGAIDLTRRATIAYSSEDSVHPIEHLVDEHSGRGSTFWAAAHPNSTERITLEFDEPQSLSRIVYEVEEREHERTQEVLVEVSSDGGVEFRHILVQPYTFSPQGATFQREDLRLNLSQVTHLRLTVVPNKDGTGTATLTSLRLFS